MLGSVLLAATLGVSSYAAVTLPPDAQLPVHHGVGGYGNWQPKRAALALWSGAAVVVYVLLLVLVLGTAGASSSKLPPAIILPFAQLLVLLGHLGAIRAAARGRGVG